MTVEPSVKWGTASLSTELTVYLQVMATRVDSQLVRTIGGGTKIPVAVRTVPPAAPIESRRMGRLGRLNLASSAPEHPLHQGPPPEDGLLGANTARTTALTSTAMSTALVRMFRNCFVSS